MGSMKYFELRNGGGVYARSARDAKRVFKRWHGAPSWAKNVRGMRQIGFTAMKRCGM